MPTKRSSIPHTCEQCGAEFFPFVTTPGRFCSIACYRASIRRRIEATCDHCGEAFTTDMNRPRQFCSRRCWYATKTTPPEERFWRFVDKSGECWLWTGGTMNSGYGSFNIDTSRESHRSIGAHRFSWEIHNGKIPRGMNVCHRCDTPLCVRIDHLFLGTPADNTRDKVSKGRQGRSRASRNQGESQWNAKLTKIDIPHIRQMRREGNTFRTIANRYGVSDNAIRDIVKRRTWKHVP